MFKALKYLAIALAAVVLAVLAFAANKPDTFRVERHTAMKAPPAKIFPLINDFHKWALWSPYEKLDKNLKRTYSGAEAGKGSVYEWEGNDNAGKGRMEIVEAAPTKVTIKLDFYKPFEAHNTAEFIMVPAGDSTEVTWAMGGPQPFIGKVMCLFFSMDTLVGKDFAEGLATMKALAEK
ncbi:MAG: polyketide cyclase [Cyanobacteria bacterium RYN_339]|nr:polyketide cyclase [Cyanobacteria bacterium RYN_339]